ncbi:MAG: amidohydrolase family protein [bacterium]|nr:amidohydrolase family protein [bacterium]
MTMEPALPEASAVAASEGRIVAVGNLASMQPWIDARGGTIDRTLEDKVLMPGSIRAGKRADFTVLDADPYEVGAKGLKEIRVWGTVFEGELAPLRPDPLH